MVKKSRGKQRGIQQFSLRKHRVLSRPDTKKIRTSLQITNFDKIISNWTGKALSYVKVACSKLNLVPFEFSPDNGQWVPCSTWGAAVHYILTFLAIVARNLNLTVSSIATNGYDLNSMICTAFFMVSLVSSTGIIGSSCSPKETLDLVNGLDAHLNWIQEETGKTQSLFGRTAENIRIFWIVLILHLASLNLTITSIFWTVFRHHATDSYRV